MSRPMSEGLFNVCLVILHKSLPKMFLHCHIGYFSPSVTTGSVIFCVFSFLSGAHNNKHIENNDISFQQRQKDILNSCIKEKKTLYVVCFSNFMVVLYVVVDLSGNNLV